MVIVQEARFGDDGGLRWGRQRVEAEFGGGGWKLMMFGSFWVFVGFGVREVVCGFGGWSLACCGEVIQEGRKRLIWDAPKSRV